MHRKKIGLSICFGMFILLFNQISIYAINTFRISNYTIHINVDKSAVFDVVETIDIASLDNLEFSKDILQNYSYDANNDGTNESYAYGISDIDVQNASFTTSEESGMQRIHITVEDISEDVIISYKVRMRDIPESTGDVFLYNMLQPIEGAMIESFQLEMILPSRLDTHMDVYSIDQAGNRMQAITYQLQNNTLSIQRNEELSAGTGIVGSAMLRDFYFDYSNPLTLHLYVSIFSILFVMFTYALMFYYPKTRGQKRLKECYPIENLKMGTLGYILDGVCDEKDIMCILIGWANQNYIQIRDENQTITLLMIKELSKDAPDYEKYLFDIIFGDYMMVTIDQLKERSLHHKMVAIEAKIYQDIASHNPSPIFSTSSIPFQFMALCFVVIPLSFTLYACSYQESFVVSISLLHALVTAVFIACNTLPWILLLKHRYHLRKNVLEVSRLLIGLINFVCGIAIYNYMLQHFVPTVYAVIAIIATILEVCIMIFMDKRTRYGRTLRNRLLLLRQFMRSAQSNQLEDILYDTPYYFEDMLPYAYSLEVFEIWGKKFHAITLQAPYWYVHANSTAYSTIYWMSSLEKSLRQIQEALMEENTSIAKEKDEKLKKKAQD